MKVTLIDYTGKGNGSRAAAELMVFTKSTRLTMSPGLLDAIRDLSDDDLHKELEYMANTIPSSWEFCDYTFLIEGVTRAFTHQFVRNRHGSYAQQTMRVLSVEGFTYYTGPSIAKTSERADIYDDAMSDIGEAYRKLLADGAEIEDARGVLPTNICTNIIAKFNLRTLSEIVSKRSSVRTQTEYRHVLDQMYAVVVEAHPWAELFLHNRKFMAAEVLQDFIISCGLEKDQHIKLLKAVDIMRG